MSIYNTRDLKPTINYQLYELDKKFKEKINLYRFIKQAQDFYNGKQYPENTTNMPRVTINICQYSVNMKASKICGTPTYIQFTAEDANIDCTALGKFDEYNLSKLNDQTENFQTVKDAENNGLGIVLYRWDEDDTSYKGIYKGGLAQEQIDILRFAVANPYTQDIQNQKWVMYWKACEVQAVRDMVEERKTKAETDAVKAKILPDDYDSEGKDEFYDMSTDEINHGLVTLYVRYFRINGEVCFTLETKYASLFKHPHALSTQVNQSVIKHLREIQEDYEKRLNEPETKFEDDVDTKAPTKVIDYDIDYEDVLNQATKYKKLSDSDYETIKEKFSLYPFAILALNPVNNSFYGQSDTMAIRSLQKSINFLYSMLLACAQNNAYSKIIVKSDALMGQTISNEPSEIITDYSRNPNSWGIKFAESQQIPNSLADLADRLFTFGRKVYGFDEVMDGSVTNQDISGWALQQMIKQSNSSIEQQQKIFWKFLSDKAAIRLMFYKFYVDKAKYTFENDDATVDYENTARERLQQRRTMLQAQGKDLEIGSDINLDEPVRKVEVREFNGKDIYGINFDIAIDTMTGLADSKLVESQMWDTLIINGGIQNMSPDMLEMYMEGNPSVSKHTKQALKRVVNKLKLSENTQLKQQVAFLTKALEQYKVYVANLESQTQFQKNYEKNLTKEFTNKLNQTNAIINMQNEHILNQQKQQNNGKMSSVLSSVSEGEAKSMNARGIDGANIEN